MSRVTETGMAGAAEGFSTARSDKPEARSEAGCAGHVVEIGGGSPVLGP